MMQKLLVPVVIALCLIGCRPAPSAPPAPVQPVNAVLGDVSYVEQFGERPDARAGEVLRIRTHLAYVERLLRARPVDHLSPEQQAARALNLDRLNAYWQRGVFPRNYAFPSERRPTFIDPEGRLCAVGYLVEQSAGRALAEAVNARYQYALIAEMDLPELDAWAAGSGLTKHELAMIQPTYDGICRACIEEPDASPRREAEIGVMALNAGAAALNGYLITRDRPNYLASGLGLVMGVTGVGLGLAEEAQYRTADLVFAGASLALSGWALRSQWRSRFEDDSRSALRPHAAPALVPAAAQAPKPGLALRWEW